jgi:hypothetical protein
LRCRRKIRGAEGGLGEYCSPVFAKALQRLAKKGQNGYSSSVTWQHSSSCLDRKFKQSGKKYVEKIKASKAIEAGSTIKAHETITTKSIDTISDTRTVG